MRADRLLSLLMLLQSRGQMTAEALARRLEVSERTIYRDIDALSAAGIPIYGESGPTGGFALLNSYRTNLTGLTEGEVRALFMLSIPAPLEELGVSQELRSALLKLSAALPDSHRRNEAKVRQRFHLDSAWWRQGEEQMPHLPTIHHALWQDRQLHLVYRSPVGMPIKRRVAPYGLVAKAGVWYLVCARQQAGARSQAVRVHRVSDLLEVQIAEETFDHPLDFDLPAFWQAWCLEYESLLTGFTATVRVAPEFVPELPRRFGSQIHHKIAQAGPPDEAGWITLELSFQSFEDARDRLLSFGRGAEVVEPYALHRSILDYAEQIILLYRH
ncbi:MAG: WYL domain-containing protein [Anaerolineaceae bacterium]|nr:WYL domain-containing protein [Anaerolineaceae bacterium]